MAKNRQEILNNQRKIIKMAQGQLNIDEATYRKLLNDEFGKNSSTKLNIAERAQLIDIFKEKGFVLKSKKGNNTYPDRPKNIVGNSPRARHLKKIEALLTVGKKPWSYAHAMAKHMYKVDDITFLSDPEDLRGIISALVKQGRKEGWDLNE